MNKKDLLKPRGVVPEYLEQPYAQEYKRMGVEPQDYAGGPIVNALKKRGPNVAPVVSSTPRQTRTRKMAVQVGNHEEHSWMDERVAGPREQPEDEEYLDIDALQGLNPFEVEIGQEEPQRPPTRVWTGNENKTEAAAPQSSLSEGEFGVFVNNKLVGKLDSSKKLKEFVEYLVLEKNVELAKIVVYKRIVVDFGVIVYD